MNWKTVRKLNKNNLFTFGGHSHSHETLPKLNLKNLNKEINISLKLINKNLNMKAIHYAYPDGLKSSFNKKIIKVLKRKKQLTCPTAINGLNRMDDDLFKLKRVFVS